MDLKRVSQRRRGARRAKKYLAKAQGRKGGNLRGFLQKCKDEIFKIQVMTENEISKIIVNTCYDIHVELGPGLLESVYEEILFAELVEKN